jgi:hypothetical protein
VAVIVVAGAVATGWAVFWALCLPAVSGRSALSIAGRLPVRVVAAALVAVVIGCLLAWAFGSSQTQAVAAVPRRQRAGRRSRRLRPHGSIDVDDYPP